MPSNTDQKNKLMVLEFSRYMFNKINGFNKQIFLELINSLPDGTNIRGFAERPDRDVSTILISHDSFPELTDWFSYPIVQAVVYKNISITGEETFKVSLIWPKEYKDSHTCQYFTYQGFNVTEEICKICGNKK